MLNVVFYAITDAKTGKYLTTDGKMEDHLTGLSIYPLFDGDGVQEALNDVSRRHPTATINFTKVSDDIGYELIGKVYIDPTLRNRLFESMV